MIIHYNLPQNIENYIHRSGRTARIYHQGVCIAFISPGDTKSLYAIEKLLGKKIEKYQVDQEKLRNSEDLVRLACEISVKERKIVGGGKDNA